VRRVEAVARSSPNSTAIYAVDQMPAFGGDVLRLEVVLAVALGKLRPAGGVQGAAEEPPVIHRPQC
jgi:hypothetical protein